MLLIGNFGDGRINAYEPAFNTPMGPLRDRHFRPIQIDGLWSIAFGNGFQNQPVNTRTLGPNHELMFWRVACDQRKTPPRSGVFRVPWTSAVLSGRRPFERGELIRCEAVDHRY